MENVEIRRGPGRPRKEDSEAEGVDTMRNDIRPDLRETDPHEAAAKRAAEILAQGVLDQEDNDKFFIPTDLRHPDWTMEWKRWSVINQEDPGYINSLLRTGWSFVPSKRAGFERFLPRGWKEEFILKEGMVLMERPAEITDLVNRRSLHNAREQIRLKEEQLGQAPPGTLQRADSTGRPVSARGVSGTKRTFAGPIPD